MVLHKNLPLNPMSIYWFSFLTAAMLDFAHNGHRGQPQLAIACDQFWKSLTPTYIHAKSHKLFTKCTISSLFEIFLSRYLSYFKSDREMLKTSLVARIFRMEWILKQAFEVDIQMDRKNPLCNVTLITLTADSDSCKSVRWNFWNTCFTKYNVHWQW